MARTFLITGASRGVGLELAKQLLEAGHTVIATARKPEKSGGLQELARQYPDTCLAEWLDVTNDKSLGILVDKLKGKHVVDVLVNNAGVFCEAMVPLAKVSLDDIRKTFETNTVAPMRVARAVLPLLEKSKQPTIINISSNIGSITGNSMVQGYGYCMSKAALNMFTSMVARAEEKITCVSLHPGWVQTDMGGKDAAITPEESARGLCEVIGRITPADSGKFYNYKGEQLPW